MHSHVDIVAMEVVLQLNLRLHVRISTLTTVVNGQRRDTVLYAKSSCQANVKNLAIFVKCPLLHLIYHHIYTLSYFYIIVFVN